MKVLNTLENLEVVANYYSDNYVYELQVEDPKLFNKMIKDYVVFETEDGIKFAIEYRYDAIKKVIYYDDETKEPELTEEYFIYYNTRHNNYGSTHKENTLLAYYPYNNNAIYAKNWRAVYDHTYIKIRDLTEDEKNFLLNVAEEKDNHYIKRVRAYYKRYKDIIYTDGYYANR